MEVFIIFIAFLASANLVFCEFTSSGRINDSEYTRLPPLYQYEVYGPCLHRPGGVYCTTKFDLVADESNELYDLIKEYSSYTKINYNHSQLQYGICITDTCKDFYNNNTTWDPNQILEGCLNETFYNKYKLHTRITEKTLCTSIDEPINIDTGDIVVAVVGLLILVANIVGSLYDAYCKPEKSQHSNKLLEYFSVQRNLRRLFRPTKDVKQERLKGLYGFRFITTVMVIFVHAMLPFILSADNPHYLEELYQNKAFQLMINATLVVQTFFICSGFLLVYNLEQRAEKQRIRWTMLPKGILLRWLRLTPTYAIVLAITATWLRHAGSGPFWQTFVTYEVNDCRKDWWYNLLYVNNYVDSSSCMPQAWYIASDLQLTVLGLIAYVLVPKGGRMVAFLVLLIIGILTPAVTTYILDLDAVFIVSPEVARNIFTKDAVFDHIYKRGHTNMACYALGLVTGLLVYRWQKTDFDFNKYIKSRYVYWTISPVLAAICMCGNLFYLNDYPLIVRAIYAGLVKPAFGVCVCLLIVGSVFKYEKVYRGVLEWRGWGVLARLAYCAYCVHIFIIRGISGSRTTLIHTSVVHGAEALASTLLLTLAFSVPLWLFVEAPFGRMVRLMSEGSPNSSGVKGIDNPAAVQDEKIGNDTDTKINVKL